MDRQNAAFAELRGTCDRLSRELQQAGIGAAVKHAAVISATEEEQLWSSGAIGIYSPKALVRCVFYYVGKAFCICGGQEQRDLKPSQFLREYNPDRYTYEEMDRKTIQATLAVAVITTRTIYMLRLIIHHQSALSTYLISTFRNSLNRPTPWISSI